MQDWMLQHERLIIKMQSWLRGVRVRRNMPALSNDFPIMKQRQ